MELRERITEEATRQFLQYGIRNVTMDGIATSLGISKRTVYEIFKDKTELVHVCLDILTKKHEEKNNEIISNSRNVIETIFTFMREGIKAMTSINPVFFFDMKKFYPVTWDSLSEENERKAFNLTKKLLERGIKEGLFRSDINIAIVSKLFHEQMKLVADDNIFPREDYNYADIFQSLTINFMRGISTNKGIKVIDTMIYT
ncbi:MAG: TetR/AcrR family transcriptional regulator [Prolixibacteraceae bacterium]|nr:TetR/AcrR family transcriptional regulator [Prolixibacteraceae bacterium]